MEHIQLTFFGKTSLEPSAPMGEKISASSSKKSAKSKTKTLLFLDLDLKDATLLGGEPETSWEEISALHGVSWTPNIGEFPKDEEGSSLWQILEVDVPQRYYLSEKACRGVLRRAAKRGKELPRILLLALLRQGNVGTQEATEMGINLQPLRATTTTELLTTRPSASENAADVSVGVKENESE